MKYLAAYALLVLGGKANPTVIQAAEDVKNVLKEVGVDVQDAQVTKVLEALKGKQLQDVEWVINEGMKKVQTLSFGGSSAPAPQAATKTAPVQVKEEKKEEKKPEPEEEVGVGGLFDD